MGGTSGDGPFGPTGDPGARSRPHKALTALLCVVAVAGIGLSGWAVVTRVLDFRARSESRERIEEGCGGLVDPDLVLALHGGTDRVELSDRHSIHIDRRSSECAVHRTDRPGTPSHFSLVLTLSPEDPGADDRLVKTGHEPFERFSAGAGSDVTAVARYALPHPLGDGSLGEYDAETLTARAHCAPGGPFSTVEAEVRAWNDDPLTAQDRRQLAGLARQAADRAAGRSGCTAGLPPVPTAFPVPGTALGPAAEAGGTCAWYGKFTAAEGRGPLPDRALAAPAGKASDHDACLLALSPEGTAGIWPAYERTTPNPRDLHKALTLSPLWIQTDTLVGDETRGLRAGRAPVRAGTAGGEELTWWASSVCGGRPAVHLMQVSHEPYDDILRDRLEPLFRAYVDEATARRGCTGVAFPRTADFAGR
ncbi:hypothetical protein [Streptomyces nitrosporeus]|uniref:hypothetical protein n=1 Tax=Streptomyces nitrosporeus TaxID=28894 RepID=UPI0033165A53